MGKSGGSPGPSQNTTVTSNIPEYAKPYVTNMLEATQRQIFKGNKTPEGGFNITGFEGYQPYSADMGDYYAGFSPLQKQAQFDAGAMEQPGQFALGSGLAGSAGIRSLGAAGQFAQNITNKQRVDASGKPMFDQYNNPIFDASNTTQSYMSPYQQGVTDVAKQSALREAQMAQNAQNLGAARQGTYGGARQTLAGMERERNLLSNLSNIQTQGSQAAYDRALQTQQFGAGLGMQGYGQALGAGSALGQIGATQQGTDIARQNQMAAMGQQQQALEQSKINQAIQDYATQQQYPLMQLGFMSNMLRGLPMQAATTQSYQAAPTPITQGLGLLAGAAGAKQAGLFREGGTIKGLASGGVAGYANRGMVQANPNSGVVQGIRQKLEMMPPEQLQQVAQTSSSEEVRAMALEVLREKQIREQAESQAQQSIMQDQRGAPQAQNMGISAAPAGSMDTLSAASGGIVAFANEGEVELDPEKEKRMRQDFLEAQQYTDFVRKQRESSGVGAPKAALAEFYAKQQADLGDERKRARGYDLMQFGVDLASQAGSLPYAVAKAGQKTLPGIISRQEGIRGRESDIAKGLAEVAEGERLMKAGDITAANAMFEKARGRESAEKIAGMKTPGNMSVYAQNYLAEKVAAGDKRDPAAIIREGQQEYMALYGAAGSRAATAAVTATSSISDKIRDDANKEIATYNTPGNNEFKAKLKARQAEPDYKKLTPAEKSQEKARISAEVRDKIIERMRKNPQASSSPSGGGGGGGSRTPSLPSGFVPDKKS
jgi:hypothetical protein